MIGLDRLMKTPGVLAAGQFDESGKISRSVGEISDEMKEKAAEVAAKISAVVGEQSKSLAEDIDNSWESLHGWAFWSGKYAFCVVGKTGAIVETSKADFNKILIDLIDEGPTGARQMNI